jgi:hypothetical protein
MGKYFLGRNPLHALHHNHILSDSAGPTRSAAPHRFFHCHTIRRQRAGAASGGEDKCGRAGLQVSGLSRHEGDDGNTARNSDRLLTDLTGPAQKLLAGRQGI